MLNHPRTLKSFTALFGALACALFTSNSLGQTEVTPPLMASDAAAGNNFGRDVAIDGDWLIAGSPNNSPLLSGFGAGAAYIYSRTAGVWGGQTQLHASDRVGGDQFGTAVAVNGNWVAVGAPDEEFSTLTPSSGSVYLYEWNGTAWGGGPLAGPRTQTQKISGFALSNEHFGCAVALDGDTLVVGADQFFTAQRFGSARVYRRVGSLWSLEATLTAFDASTDDVFGHAVAINGNTVIIGAPRIVTSPTATDTGSAYVFTRSGTTWSFEAKLQANDGGAGDLFGRAVALRGDVAVIGAESHDLLSPLAPNAGAAYVYTRSGSVWTQSQKLTASDAFDDNAFGNSVAISNDVIAVGSYMDGSQTGSVYLFASTGSSWTEVTKVFATDANGLDQCSRDSLAIGVDNTLVVGAAGHEGDAFDFDDNRGAAFIFDVNGLPVPAGDSDGDGLSDADELARGTNPLDFDTDNDGMGDGLEVINAGLGTCPNPLNSDSDNDGLSDGIEHTNGPNPCDPDVDNDGLLDGTEVDIAQGSGCPSPNAADSDGDSLSDGAEVNAGTNPCNPDTDGDGIADNIDPLPLTPGVPPTFLAALTLSVAGDVIALDVGEFLGPNSNAQKGRRTALANNLQEAATAIANGNDDAAVASLMMVLNKIDGAATPPDWMPESEDRDSLYADVQALIVLVQCMP